MTETKTKPSAKIIIAAVADSFGVDSAEMFSMSRRVVVCEARHAAFDILRGARGLTGAQIGQMFGGRDSSTIRHGVHRCHAALNISPKYRQLYRAALETIICWGSADVYRAFSKAGVAPTLANLKSPPAVNSEALGDGEGVDAVRRRKWRTEDRKFRRALLSAHPELAGAR